MKRLSIITVIFLAITLLIGVFHSFVFASEGEEITPIPTETLSCTPTPTPIISPTCTPTPTEIITTITEFPIPTATEAAIFTPTPIASITALLTPSAAAAENQAAQAGISSAGEQAGAAAQSAPQVLGAVAGQVGGVAAMAPTGNFASNLMEFYAIIGMYLLLTGFVSYAKEKSAS